MLLSRPLISKIHIIAAGLRISKSQPIQIHFIALLYLLCHTYYAMSTKIPKKLKKFSKSLFLKLICTISIEICRFFCKIQSNLKRKQNTKFEAKQFIFSIKDRCVRIQKGCLMFKISFLNLSLFVAYSRYYLSTDNIIHYAPIY